MKLSDMFPSRFIRGVDLNGCSITVTISHVQLEKMRPSPQSPELEKIVLYTVEGKNGKGIVMSKTLATQIAQAVGKEETDEWVGKQVTLYPEPVTVAGVQRVAIRARSATTIK
jgi:hypothetical protein